MRKSGFELWEAYRINLKVLNDRIKEKDPKPSELLQRRIDDLLNEGYSSDRRWEALFEAEQRLSYHLTISEVNAEFPRRLKEARNISVASVEDISAYYEKILLEPDAASKQDKLRALYLALLDDIHFRYIKRMLDRRVRRETGVVMIKFGAGALIFITIVLIWFVGHHYSLYTMTPVFMTAVSFGMVGAFLSRLISFHAQLEQIDYDSLRNGFSEWVILIRILIGGFSAIIFVCLTFGGFLTGDLFPVYDMDRCNPDATAPSLWTVIERLFTAFECGPGDAVPGQNAAKLVVWSLISGFSERLLPDSFSKLDARVQPTPPRIAERPEARNKNPADTVTDDGINPPAA